ncbi:ribonuclease T2 family protein [Acinetobacter junii]|uniref:ribonuclease T2 family protein n=1 Tax=Acinetobacter junii TaxID=40215 RepID=UPI00148EF33E|nr:ribonuclease I [Acinetobacter junii]
MKFLYLMKSMCLMKESMFRAIQILICYLALSFAVPLYAADKADIAGYVMHVQMTPAVCSFDSSRQKQRKCLEGYSLTISSLLPEVPVGRDCQTKSSAKLSPLQAKVVARVMPDENARVQLWQNVGGCVPMNASQYFRTIINFAERLKIPADLTSPNTIEVQKENLRQQFTKLNPSLPPNGIRFTCQTSKFDSILTEIRVCYQKNGQYKQCSSHVVTGCPSEFTIKGSY